MKISQWISDEAITIEPVTYYGTMTQTDDILYSGDGLSNTYDVELVADRDYDQYENNNTPQGLNVLVGDIMPWHDYVILRTGEYTSVAVYGNKSEDLTFNDCTVRTVTRESSSGYTNYYTVSDDHYDTVTVDVSNPYYCYGNTIGVAYALPSANNVMSMAVCACVVVCAVISVFRLIWSLRRVVI